MTDSIDRIDELENKLDEMNGRIDTLTNTIAEAMKLFSHSESSTHIELTERRFQSSLKDTTGIQSRYRSTQFGTIRPQV